MTPTERGQIEEKEEQGSQASRPHARFSTCLGGQKAGFTALRRSRNFKLDLNRGPRSMRSRSRRSILEGLEYEASNEDELTDSP